MPASYVTLLRDRELRALLIQRRGWMLVSARDHEAADAEAAVLLEMIRDQFQ